MSSFGIRPHFSETVDLDPGDIQTKIVREVEQTKACCEIKNFPGYLCLRIPEEERHFWSPQLTLSIDATEEGKTQLSGIYGPNANVWSIFIYGYLLTGSIGLFSGILGGVQWHLDELAWGLWIFPATVAIAVGLYLLAQFGQKLGAAQTFQLHQIYESAMGRRVEIR